jgi:hypothetical protein
LIDRQGVRKVFAWRPEVRGDTEREKERKRDKYRQTDCRKERNIYTYILNTSGELKRKYLAACPSSRPPAGGYDHLPSTSHLC